MTEKTINILSLYPSITSDSGDQGNLLVLSKRLKSYGYQPNIISHDIGDKTQLDSVDIVVGGGSEDYTIVAISEDLPNISDKLHELADSGAPMLLVGSLFQLSGRRLERSDGSTLAGIGLFDAETTPGKISAEHKAGGILIDCPDFGQVIGFEKHSGITRLDSGVKPLGRVLRGHGNGDGSKLEGAWQQNVIGTNLHGPLLPKNPQIADWIIRTALINKSSDSDFRPLQDPYSELARNSAKRSLD